MVSRPLGHRAFPFCCLLVCNLMDCPNQHLEAVHLQVHLGTQKGLNVFPLEVQRCCIFVWPLNAPGRQQPNLLPHHEAHAHQLGA